MTAQQLDAPSLASLLSRRLEGRLAQPSPGHPLVVAGVVEPAWPWCARALPATGTTLVVAHDAQAASQLAPVLSLLDGDATVLTLPERDPLPYEWLSSDARVTGGRLASMLALSGKPPTEDRTIVVASVRALLQLTIPPDALGQKRQRWHPGDRLRMSSVLSSWLALGYEAVSVVEEAGTFSRRGGIIDVFPAGADVPVRIELFDDEIESLRAFDPMTQRSTEPVEDLVILPAREALPDAGPEVARHLASLDASGCREDVQVRWQECLGELREGRSFDGIELLVGHLHPPATALDYLPEGAQVAVCDLSRVRDVAARLEAQQEELATALPARGDVPPGLKPSLAPWAAVDARAAAASLALLEPGASPAIERGELDGSPALARALRRREVVELVTAPAPEFQGRIPQLFEQCKRWCDGGWRVLFATLQRERLEELLNEADLPMHHGDSLSDGLPVCLVTVVGAQVPAGWLSESERVVVLTDRELFGPQPQVMRRKRTTREQAQAFLADLDVGDFVVHIDHGVGRFAGITHLDQGAGERGYLLLEYAGSDKLYVPTDQLDRVTKYVGATDTAPQLNRLGGSEWARTKARAREAVQRIAKDLLQLYAQRMATPGFAFPPDTPWQHEMEAAFPFDETPDQLRAIEEVKADMESEQIMDRLVCGDVGFGKTEVALRAAFKAVMSGKQVAMLVPTTVLAQQHERTFRERLAAFPVKVEMLSRFRTPQEQKAVVKGVASGTVDIVIGTHRLLRKDVAFKDLGLLIVDEEQRFGVAHKEALKRLRTQVDVLTLTATPIPRTLHMALAGVRDMSVIDTPPEERQPVKTYIARYDDRLVRDAILRELDRGGQVYVVHNRVQTIPLFTSKVAKLVPDAKVAYAHGQMSEDRLERVMLQFSAGDYQVLVCTTIIENGLDISNVNTIVINQATHMGLAQLYQLRGRVGRSNRRAYAYLLYSHDQRLPPVAEKRLRAVFEASDLGAGFRIAMKDLEIRGAGNLLGAEQHGHVAAVGFDLYTKMLAEAVEEMRGTPIPPAPQQVIIDLAVPAYLPDDYVADQATRIDCYRRLALATTLEAAADLRKELEDRFGPLPEAVSNLVDIVEIKVLCQQAAVRAVHADAREVTVRLEKPREYPRSALIRRYGAQARLRPELITLPRQRIGDRLLEGVKEAVRMVS